MPPSDPALSDNPLIVIGGNNPPELTPFEIAEKAVNEIYDETVLWLDGQKIDSQELADGVANLLAEIRKAEKLADDTRTAEKAPLDEAVKAIQAKYAPLIADTKSMKGKTVLAAQACKAALQPWLDAEDRRLAAEAAAARAEADRKRQEAEAALRASEADNLAEREAAEEQLREARKAEAAANVASRKTATAGGAFGRAVGLRTGWEVVLDDPQAAARHYWTTDRSALDTLLLSLAERDIKAGKRGIPGVVIVEKKTAA